MKAILVCADGTTREDEFKGGDWYIWAQSCCPDAHLSGGCPEGCKPPRYFKVVGIAYKPDDEPFAPPDGPDLTPGCAVYIERPRRAYYKYLEDIRR